MGAMAVLDQAERRRRLAVRHALAPAAKAAGPADAASRVVALHGTDPASVFLAVAARTDPVAAPAAIEAALYEQRELIRMLGMRRTVFVVPAGLAPVVQAASMPRVAATQRARLCKLLRDAGFADPEPWLAEVEESVLAALAARGGIASAAELAADEPRLRTALLLAPGKPYEARQNITSRVLLGLGAQGRIVRGRPAGSWLSQQYRWALTSYWLPGPAAGAAGTLEQPGLTGEQAQAELARRWLAAFGPAPLADLAWWTGWPVTQARRAASAAGAVEAGLGPGTGLALPDDLGLTPDPGPWTALLPALDPTVMGWADRSWFLGPHGPALFDRSGNAGPSIWQDGRIVGGWAQRPGGEVAIRLLADVGAEGAARAEAEAARTGDWLARAGVRIIPRFRTPLERELSAG
jgi:hypothetical protein